MYINFVSQKSANFYQITLHKTISNELEHKTRLLLLL